MTAVCRDVSHRLRGQRRSKSWCDTIAEISVLHFHTEGCFFGCLHPLWIWYNVHPVTFSHLLFVFLNRSTEQNRCETTYLAHQNLENNPTLITDPLVAYSGVYLMVEFVTGTYTSVLKQSNNTVITANDIITVPRQYGLNKCNSSSTQSRSIHDIVVCLVRVLLVKKVKSSFFFRHSKTKAAGSCLLLTWVKQHLLSLLTLVCFPL